MAVRNRRMQRSTRSLVITFTVPCLAPDCGFKALGIDAFGADEEMRAHYLSEHLAAA